VKRLEDFAECKVPGDSNMPIGGERWRCEAIGHHVPVVNGEPMSRELLSSGEAARRLGISIPRLYEWLALSDRGDFLLRGAPITIDYFQGGARGQGRIRIAAREVDRLLDLMRVKPVQRRKRQSPTRRSTLRHITAKPGRPDK
jgi:hypothetical protein